MKLHPLGGGEETPPTVDEEVPPTEDEDASPTGERRKPFSLGDVEAPPTEDKEAPPTGGMRKLHLLWMKLHQLGGGG